jgi:2-dehydropantoate 2-reductase
VALGEPTNGRSDRVTALSNALSDGGLRAPVVRDIRAEVWTKLLGNLAFNPLSVLTGETLDRLAAGADTRPLVEALMREAQAVGERLGVRFPMSIAKRIEAAAAVGAHKTSMLQDWERGRPLEIDALVGSVAELGRRVNLPTPTIDIVYGLVRERARAAGVLPTPP